MLNDRRLRPRDELQPVLAIRQNDLELMIAPGTRIVLLQPLAQMMRIHPNDRILLRVKRSIPAKHVQCDAVLGDLAFPALQILVAQVREQTRKLWGTPENIGCQDSTEFSPAPIIGGGARTWLGSNKRCHQGIVSRRPALDLTF